MRLFVFGLGYTALSFIHSPGASWTRIAGTVRQERKAQELRSEGVAAYALTEEADEARMADEIRTADAILVSAPPADGGDPTLNRFRKPILSAPNVGWIGYLSTTGVYGDHGGAWIDEAARPAPLSPSSHQRVAAERAWLDLGSKTGSSIQVFRLTGIYGPGRNAFVNLAQGSARRIVKPGQVFNRIHVEDIAAILRLSLQRPRPGGVYNVSDDEPAPPQDVIAYAAHLAGIDPPAEIPYEEAALSPAGRSFYGENKRVSNRLIKEEFDVRLRYPTYREGLQALFAAGEYAQVA